MEDLRLSARKKAILRAIVDAHIRDGEPIGSKFLAQDTEISASPATIRNEMAELAAHGYLEQPHTSAGRIPAPRGYRFYVNDLMEEHRLSVQETERLNQALHLKMRELDRVIDEAGRIVSRLTRYPAFALTSGAQRLTIRRFDLLLVDENAFIAVVMTDQNAVANKLFRLSQSLSEAQLQMLSTLLNASFTGLTLEELTPQLAHMAAQAAREAMELISLVVSFAMEVLEEQQSRYVHTAGIDNLLSHPEYQDLSRAQPLMTYLAQTENLGAFPLPRERGTSILIGPENVHEALKDSSVVLATYDMGGGAQGVIGVIGPTRMDYATVLARLQYLARGLTQLFEQNQLPTQRKEDI